MIIKNFANYLEIGCRFNAYFPQLAEWPQGPAAPSAR